MCPTGRGFQVQRGRSPTHGTGQCDAKGCLLYTSDAADERSSVDLGGRRIIKKTKQTNTTHTHTHKKKKKDQNTTYICMSTR